VGGAVYNMQMRRVPATNIRRSVDLPHISIRPRTASLRRAGHTLSACELPGKGRGVLALEDIHSGTTVLTCAPMAQVLKTADIACCATCLAPLVGKDAARHCCRECAEAHAGGGGALLDRVDLSSLNNLHTEQGRKFPLLIASLLASLLAEIKALGRVPETWAPLELCFAELHEEADEQVESEYEALIQSFESAGLANRPTLELFLPLPRYRRLLGAAQLNAFELTLSHGAKVSALLPGLASCFNHSCEPNVLVSCGEAARASFVVGEPIAAGEELCISYVDLALSRGERQELLLHKYGFECRCPRCVRGLS